MHFTWLDVIVAPLLWHGSHQLFLKLQSMSPCKYLMPATNIIQNALDIVTGLTCATLSSCFMIVCCNLVSADKGICRDNCNKQNQIHRQTA